MNKLYALAVVLPLLAAAAHWYSKQANEQGWPDFTFVEPAELSNRGYKVTVVKQDPLIVEFEDFLAEKEIEALVALGEPNLARSTGGLNREVSSYRTSSTAWLMPDVLKKDPKRKAIVEALEQRIADILGIPIENQEHFQVLKYEPGQYYRQHNDYIVEQAKFPCGPRVATFFLYLNDVEDGGGTRFGHLGITVRPKRGRALLWYSVKSPTDLAMDSRTDHEAQDVIKGVKWGANKWVHVGNFVDNWAVGKTG